MAPPEDSAGTRGRRRSHHACLTCRRKKSRCPGEKPACSSCVRLNQSCSYPPAIRSSHQSGRSEERLAHLEEKLDFLLSGSRANHPASRQKQDQPYEDVADNSENSYSGTPPSQQQQQQQQQQLQSLPTHSAPSRGSAVISPCSEASTSLQHNPSTISVAITLYFRFCHRQPIWCFERDEVSDYGSLPEELICSILTLTSRFSERQDQAALYSKNAKSLILRRIANGQVELTTIESLCLLSCSSFIDGNAHLGQFHLGLAFQLCRSAQLDMESGYAIEDPNSERKRRLFWSLQLLEQLYGRQNGLLSLPTEIWRPSYSPGSGAQLELDPRAPCLPRDELGTHARTEPGIWNTSVHLGWVWSQVRKYVSDCAHNILKEPWRNDSMYAKVVSDFMETENRIPICHRYDSVKFYGRKVDELKMNRDYWAPWIKEQFMYHAIPTVMNHPFLYIVGAQHNPNLAIPNTFWRRSSELALLHSTWIVRFIDMVVDKQVPLVDPFFGHVAAIAATVHLYYCCSAASRLKHKSNTDFAKCRRFLKGFLPHSAACQALDRSLDRMTRIAAGSESMDVEDWMPSKIYLSVPLMWEILQFDFMSDSNGRGIPTTGLLDKTLTPAPLHRDMGESSTLEIIVATSPEITIDTADGGQEAPTLPFKSSNMPTINTNSPQTSSVGDKMSVEQTDALTFTTTPWLYADPSQFVNVGDMGYSGDSQQLIGDNRTGGIAWWEDENFSNIMFNQF
ncbi:unnamed protein product [Clonostachys rosea]|uniref:Zn(2)-C6 fungal-type domain-containing protein n=1 Tax=Bionectria ochroleuca TaxID=29856 RepID=A0ABY6U5U1_BIOOC|nr:unnamed protein product [Clonostachys rosea]